MPHISKILLIYLTFSLLGNSQITILEDFSNIEVTEWNSVDGDGDGLGWSIGYPPFPTDVWSADNSVAISNSFDLALGPLTPENFLVSPLISFENYSGKLWLRWRSGTTESTEGDSFEEYYSVYLVNDLDIGLINKENFDLKTPIFQGMLSAGNTAIFNQVDVSAFAGRNNLRLIFRHHNCTDEFNLFIDGISLENNAVQLAVEDILYEDLLVVYWGASGNILNVKSTTQLNAGLIYDFNGKIVASSDLKNNYISADNLEAGIYFLSVLTDKNQLITKKIIKN